MWANELSDLLTSWLTEYYDQLIYLFSCVSVCACIRVQAFKIHSHLWACFYKFYTLCNEGQTTASTQGDTVSTALQPPWFRHQMMTADKLSLFLMSSQSCRGITISRCPWNIKCSLLVPWPKIRSCHRIALTVCIKINTKNNRLLSVSKAL